MNDILTSSMSIFIIAFIVISIISLLVYIIRKLDHYPLLYIDKDISGSRNIDKNDFADSCLNKTEVREQIQLQPSIALAWKLKMLDKHPTQAKKINKIYEKYNNNDLIFRGIRKQTRYVQRNYQRSPYTVNIIEIKLNISRELCLSRIEKLKEYNFELTVREGKSKEQRKLMTPELKEKIKIRDNYTCQICGKEMHDEVGLQIDHIIPVAKGGLSIEKNLRVLCSKCNGSKGAKIEE
jgi:hypothetical protein